MTGSLGGVVEPTALLGRWQLTRRVRDEQSGQSGWVDGQLTLRAEDGHFLDQRCNDHAEGVLKLPKS